MPFSHDWYDEEQTIIHSRIIVPWTWDDYVSEVGTIMAMMDEVEHPVVSIGDYTQAGGAPSGIITHLPAIAHLINHPNFEHFVVIGITSPLGRSGARVFERIYGKLSYANSIDEAIALIKTARLKGS